MEKSVRGVLKIDDFILLIKRIKDKKTYYVFPGGHKEGNESDRETCIREFREETNLDILPLKHIQDIKEGQAFITSYYLCKLKVNITGSKLPKLKIIGPEVDNNALDNQYKPLWINIHELEGKTIYPDAIIKMIVNGEI